MKMLDMCLGGMAPGVVGKIYRQTLSHVGLANNFIQADDTEG